MKTVSRDRARVLVVDDQPNWLEALHDMLDPTSYEIDTASSYDEATDKLRQHAFEVVVTDQRLVDEDETNMQGIVLLDEVSELRDGTQTIVVTGYPTVEAAKKAIKGRDAYDYILKRPEGGGPFKIREYREQVEEAARQAIRTRQKAITLGFSLSSLVPGLDYGRIAETIFRGGSMPGDAPSRTKVVLNRLLYPLQPLARGMGRAWFSESDCFYEILCWSRNYGNAVLIKIGREQTALETKRKRLAEQIQHPLRKIDQHEATPIAGISFVIDEMTFEDFRKLVEEK